MYEGTFCHEGPCSPTGRTMPLYEYAHADGRCSVTGGFVYRGQAVPELVGRYVFGEYCTGEVWAYDPLTDTAPLLFDASVNITSFGVDHEGEIYVLGSNGSIRRITRI